jgi:hypothetical protein
MNHFLIRIFLGFQLSMELITYLTEPQYSLSSLKMAKFHHFPYDPPVHSQLIVTFLQEYQNSRIMLTQRLMARHFTF